MSLDSAIKQLEAEVDAFKQGTSAQPREGSADWFLLRAKSLGLSHLRRMKQLEMEGNPGAAERFHRISSKQVKGE